MEEDETVYTNKDIYLKKQITEEMNEIADINNDTYLRTDLCEEITWDSFLMTVSDIKRDELFMKNNLLHF